MSTCAVVLVSLLSTSQFGMPAAPAQPDTQDTLMSSDRREDPKGVSVPENMVYVVGGNFRMGNLGSKRKRR